MEITTIEPATGDALETYAGISVETACSLMDQTHEAWEDWSQTSFAERAGLMHRAAGILRDRRDELAILMAREMGKPVRQGRAEVEKSAWVCEHYAEHARAYLAQDSIPTEARHSYAAFEPLGLVLAVMPWNFPFWQVLRFAAPALMAGNVGVLKHASTVPGCALAIERIFQEAGFPDHVFHTLLVGSNLVNTLVEHPLVRAVTLTGSTPAGRAVAAKAGSVLRKTVLELGGSDPYLVLQDADLEHAVPLCVQARLINSGQSCIAAKRFIVHASVVEEFTERFVAHMQTQVMGDPLDERTDVGPQARSDLRDDLHRQVSGSLERGAELLLGGSIPQGRGFFYPPTVLSNVTPGMPAFDQETFGPVAAIIRVPDEEEAVRLANASVFGLGAAVFTRDLERGERIARRLQAGSVFVNKAVASDPRLPFGGIRDSGYGRELGIYGIREFVNIKTVVIESSSPV